MEDEQLKDLSEEHAQARRLMRRLLFKSDASNAREIWDHYYKTVTLAEYEARRHMLLPKWPDPPEAPNV